MRCAYYRFCGDDASHSASVKGWRTRQPLCDFHVGRRIMRNPAAVESTLDGVATIYLIHLDRPLSNHASHYCGWTTNLSQRLAEHRAGTGSRFMAAVAEAGITWSVVRTWKGDRREERRLKRTGKLWTYCERCRHNSNGRGKVSERVWQRREDGECGHRKHNRLCPACKRKRETQRAAS